jgi:hypothetical protein
VKFLTRFALLGTVSIGTMDEHKNHKDHSPLTGHKNKYAGIQTNDSTLHSLVTEKAL